MSSQLLKRLVMVLGVVVVLWVVSEMVGGTSSGRRSFAMVRVDTAAIDSILIERSLDTMLLTRGTSTWLVNNWRASSDRVEELLTYLSEVPDAEIVGQNPTLHDRFDVGDLAGRTIRVMAGSNTVLELILGKRGVGSESAYVRRPGEDDVYLIYSGLLGVTGLSSDDWRDRFVADIVADSVQSVDVSRGTVEYILERGPDSGWAVASIPVDPESVRRLLSEYRNIQGSAFPTTDQMASINFDEAERHVVLRGAASRPLLALAFDSTDGAFWVRRDGDTTIFRLDRFRVDRMTPPDSMLRPGG